MLGALSAGGFGAGVLECGRSLGVGVGIACMDGFLLHKEVICIEILHIVFAILNFEELVWKLITS